MTIIKITPQAIQCPHCGADVPFDRGRAYPNVDTMVIALENACDAHLASCQRATGTDVPT